MKPVLLACLIFTVQTLHSATFNSQASGQFNNAGTWVLTSGSDTDGIPDNDDNATILTGHTVTCSAASTTNSFVFSLTIDNGGILTVSSPRQLSIRGDYQNNGTENGNGIIIFTVGGTTISGTGSFSPSLRFTFNVGANRTIAAGTVIDKSASDLVIVSATVTNLGTYTVFNTTITGTGSFVNGATGILKVKSGSAFSTGTLNASASGNQVFLQYYSLNVPNPIGGVYHHLNINGTGSLRLNGNISCNGNFTINGGNSFSQNNFTLAVKGTFTKSGSFTSSTSGEILLNGTTAQTINVSGSNITFGNLRIDNSAGVSFAAGSYTININRSLTATSGTLNLSNHTTTLTSDATATAVIGPCITGNIINGNNMNVQRFIDTRSAGYSDMAVPYSSKTIATAWDNSLLLVYAYSPPNYYPSIYTYDETAFDYAPVTSSSDAVNLGQGYEVYLDSDGNQTVFNTTTLTWTGVPYIGSLDISGNITASNDGWNLIGNPYMANLSWDALVATTSGISTTFESFDETVDNGDGTFGNFVDISSGAGELIAPGQGFWVNATTGPPTFVFTENIKSSSTSSNFRSANRGMYFGLRLRNLDKGGLPISTHFRFTSETDPSNNLPYRKLAPGFRSPVLCSQAFGKDLKINYLNTNENTITIPVKMKAYTDGLHMIEVQNSDFADFEGYTCVTLYDKQLKQYVDLNSGNYEFYAKTNDSEDRFSLILSKTGDCPKFDNLLAGVDGNVDIYNTAANTVVRFNFEQETSVNITITDLLGQTLVPSQVLIATNQEISLAIPSDFNGIYLVNVTYNNQTKSRKLYR